MPSVLFVCTANRYRSPLAAAIMKKVLDENVHNGDNAWVIHNTDAWHIDSAGTWAKTGEPALPVVSEAAQRLGIDLSSHRSKRLNRELLAEQDLILVMQASHKEALQVEFPDLNDRIYLLSFVLERGSYDIVDSMESGNEVTDIVQEMHTLIQHGFRYVCVLATANHNQRKRVP
jgi:protein-tyrosine-phosphatase